MHDPDPVILTHIVLGKLDKNNFRFFSLGFNLNAAFSKSLFELIILFIEKRLTLGLLYLGSVCSFVFELHMFINHILNQDEKSKFFKIYKKFFLNKLKENKVEIIYVVKPLWGGNEVFLKALNNNCVKKNKITEILDSYLLEQCVELNN